jgi:hypothetical protein
MTNRFNGKVQRSFASAHTVHIEVKVIELWQKTAIANHLIDLWVALRQPSVKFWYAHLLKGRKENRFEKQTRLCLLLQELTDAARKKLCTSQTAQ